MDETTRNTDGPKSARYPQYDELRAQQGILPDDSDEPGDDAPRTVSSPPVAQSDEKTRQSSPSEETTIAVMKAGIMVHIPVPPDVLLAHKIGDIKRAFNADPSKATASHFEGMLDYAIRSNDFVNRAIAWDDLTNMINTRPDMADAGLLKAVVENSKSDPASYTRIAIQRTLGAIAEKRPDLADANTVSELQRTAAIPFSTREYKVGEGIPYVGDHNADGTRPESGGVGTGRQGYQCDLDDNVSREMAQKTLGKLLKQRPDLNPELHLEKPAAQPGNGARVQIQPKRSPSVSP